MKKPIFVWIPDYGQEIEPIGSHRLAESKKIDSARPLQC
jgi:transcriptional regulator of heat shock response